MPRPVSNGNIVEVTFFGRMADQVLMSVFHYRVTGITDGADGTALSDSLNNALKLPAGLETTYTQSCSQDYAFERVTIQWIYNIRYTRQEYVPAQGQGAINSPGLPPNDSVALTKRTDTANRHNRGTLHMPGVAVQSVLNGNVTPAGLVTYSNLGTRVAALVTTADGANFTPVIFNRGTPQNSPTILTCTPQNTSRVQRRRTVGLGI